MKIAYITLISLLFIFNSFSQNIKVYKNAAGDTSKRSIVKVIALSTGDFVQLGEIETDNVDLTLTKVNSEGTILWQKTIGTAGLDGGNNLTALSDGGFAIVGYTAETTISGDDGDVLVIKTDANGIPQWAKQFGGADFDEGFGITEMTNGDLVAMGTTFSFGPSFRNAIAARFSSTGGLIWQNAYKQGSLSNYFLKGFALPNGDAALCGYSWHAGAGAATTFDPFFVKIGTNGEVLTANRLRMPNSQIIYDFERDSEGNIFWAGVTSTSTANQTVIGKVSPSFNALWTNYMGTPKADRIWDLELLPDGNLLFAGFINKTTAESSKRNGFIGKASSNGTFIQATEFGTTDTNTTELTGLAFSQGKAIAVGVTYMYENRNGAGIAISIDPQNLTQICNGSNVTMTSSIQTSTDSTQATKVEGGVVEDANVVFNDNNQVMEQICNFVSVDALTEKDEMHILPNPGTGIFNLSFHDQKERKILIYQANGMKVAEQKSSLETLEINLNSRPAGIYKILIVTVDGLFQTTLIKK